MFHLEAGTCFSHYEIRTHLGAGGMGEVYLAEDTKLRRLVAIKFIARHKEISPAAEKRFLREARAASQLNHPNIVTIFEIGEMENHDYIAMEYVEGRSLRELILACDLTTHSTLDIALQISDALAEAHAHNLLHRDIKPENIIVNERGRAKLLDFGLARNFEALSSDGSTKGETLTDSGAIVGTLPYMSPEQLRRETLDLRSDIFSFGIVFYEMLTGKHPFGGTNPYEMASLILKDEKIKTDRFSSALPQSIRTFVQRMLEKDRRYRFASFNEVKRELELLKGEISQSKSDSFAVTKQLNAVDPLSGVNFVSSLAPTVSVPAFSSPSHAPPPPSVLVLPLEAVGSQDETSFIGIGLAYSITTGLAKIRTLSVISKAASARQEEKKGLDTRAHARELGATILLEGEVLRAGQRLRIMIRLSDVESGHVIWGDQYSGDESELFQIQDTVCEAVAAVLRVSMSTDSRSGIMQPPTANMDAFELYSKGRAFIERYDVEENIDFAIQTFEKSLEHDPDFSLAYAGLGEAYWRKYQATRDEAWVSQAISAADRALVLDPRQAQVHVTLGIIYYGTGKTERAIEEFKSAIAIQPVSDIAYNWLGNAYTRQGQMQEAINCFKRAIEIRPGYWGNYNRLGVCYYSFGRYQEAIEKFRHVITIQPDNHDGYNNLGGLYCLLGRYEEAIAMHQKAIKIHPVATLYSNLGTDYFYLGRYAEALEAYKSAIELKPGNDLYYRNLGDTYLRLGREREAKEQFEHASTLLENQLAVDSMNAEAIGRLAICQAKLKSAAEAIKGIERAVQLEMHNTTLMYQRAVVYALSGDADTALESLGRALAHGYSSSEAEHDPDLEVLREREDYGSLITHYSQT